MKRQFDWDPRKEISNRRKHRVTFHEAVTVFNDPCILSRYDDEHSVAEERWVILGQSDADRVILVIHVILEQTDEFEFIRIISARKATQNELRTYQSRRPL